MVVVLIIFSPQQPRTHFPLLLYSIVTPLKGTSTLFAPTRSINFWVFVPGRTTPFDVAPSFACEGITDSGLMSWFTANAASSGPVLKISPILMTASLAP